MATIGDFMKRRWADANDVLRKLDPDFVDKLETAHRLDQLGLAKPFRIDVTYQPIRSLPSNWHRLLEACTEMTAQVSNLRAAAYNVTAKANEEVPDLEAGRAFNYNLMSWFVHGQTLTQHVVRVIERAGHVYLTSQGDRRRLVNHYKKRAIRITGHLKQTRNEFVHPVRGEAQGITEDKLWEAQIALSMTPEELLTEFSYPMIGALVKSGRYDIFSVETQQLLSEIGNLFQDFDSEFPSLPQGIETPYPGK